MAFNDVVLNISAKDIEEVALYGVKTKEQSFGREMQEQARRNINAMVLFELFDGGALSFEETESGKILKINFSQGLTIDNYGNLCVDFSQLPSSSNLNLVAHMPLEILESEDEYGNIVKNLSLSTDMGDGSESTLDLDEYNRLKVNTDVIATKKYVDEVATGDVDLSGYQKSLTAGSGISLEEDTIGVKITGGGLKFLDNGSIGVKCDTRQNTLMVAGGNAELAVNTDVVALKEDLDGLKEYFDYTKYDVPIVSINGDFDSIDEKTDIIKCDYSYENKGVTKTGYCTAKWQGSSSLNYPKKNFTIKFYTDADCTSKDKFEAKSGWGNEYKYCFKADWIDFSHSRNVVSAELWGDVVNSRKDVDTEGTINNILSQVPNGGAIDGFPIFLVINGKWQGIYNWNIPKDDWTLGMGKGVGQKEVILCASGNNSASFKQEAVIGKDYDLEYATDEKDADGNQKPETVTAIQNSLNNLIRLVIASDGSDIDTTIAKYVDIQSVIDYFIFCVLTDNYDGILKNYLLGSYDYELTDENGNFVDYGKWFFGAYDLDSVFGMTINGKPDSFGNAFRNFTYSEAKDVAPIHKLFKLLWDYKNEDIIKRYKELVKEPMSLASVTTKFCNYTSKIPQTAYYEDAKLWTGVTNTSTNNLTQVITWYENRLDFLNNKLLGSDGGEIYTKIGEFTITPQEVTVSAGQTEIPVTLKFMDSIAVYHNETKLTVNTDYMIDTDNRKIVLSTSVADGDTIKIQNELNQVYASEVNVGSGKKISRLNMVNNLKEFYIVAKFPAVESKIAVDGGAFNYNQRLFQFYTDGAISTSAKTFYAEGVRSKGKWKFELNSDTTANMKKADYKKAASQNNAPKNFGDMYFNKPVTNIGITTYPTSAVFPQGSKFTLYGIEE